MTALKVGIATPQEMKARTLAIASGALKPSADDPKIWFPSAESFARVLTAKNRDLLETIASTAPQSMQELAEATGRQPSNLSRTLKTLERYGFLTLHRGPRGTVRPVVTYSEVMLVLPLVRGPVAGAVA